MVLWHTLYNAQSCPDLSHRLYSSTNLRGRGGTELQLADIEDQSTSKVEPPSTPKLEDMQEDLDDLPLEQDLPTPESPIPEQLSPSPGPTLRCSACLQSIASQLESDSEWEDELLLTGKNAKPNGNIAIALYHALVAFSRPETYS